MKHIKYALLMIAVLVSHVVMAQKERDTHISGHVVDLTTGEHIPFATVDVVGTKFGTITDASGHFIISNVPAGTYKVEASFVGYEMQTKTVVIEKFKGHELNFELKIKPLEVDDVVVSSTRNVTKRKESPTVVGVLSHKQFEITASNNVSEVLNFQPGLRVEYNCGNCGVPQLRINGLEGQYSQILLDSRPIFSSLAGVYGLEQMPAGMIERVEVIRGGGSALFGSSAIGGVVNIITKEPKTNTLSIGSVVGVTDKGDTDVNTTFNGSFVSKDNKAGVYLFGMIRDRQSYDHNDDGFSDVPELGSETVGFRGYYKTSKTGRLTAEYHHISEYRRGGDSLNHPPHEALLAEQLQHKIDGGGVKYDIYSSDYKHKANVYASLQNIDRKSYFGTDRNPNAYGTTKDVTFVLGGQYAYSFDKFLFMPSELTAGVEYNDNRLKDEMLGYDRIIDQQSFVYGGYLQNEWKTDRWSFLVGARVDKHNKVKNAIVSPRGNIRFTPIKDKLIFRASYASGYRAPQAYDEDLHVAAVGGEVSLITISPYLKPEYSHSVSGSVDFYQAMGRWNLNLLLEGFYTNLKDAFALDDMGKDNSGNQILQRVNAAGAEIVGLNAEVRLSYADKLNLQGGFTYQKSQYKEPRSWSEDERIAPQRRMFRSPDTYGYFTVGYNPIKPLSLSVSGNYTGSMLVAHTNGYIERDREVNTPTFFDMGFKAAYNFKLSKFVNMELNAGVKNMTNSYQTDLDRGMSKDSKYLYGPNTPRTYFVGLKFVM